MSLEEFLSNATDFDELRSSIDVLGNVQVKSIRGRKPINSMLKWLEAWAPYEMLMCKNFGYNVYYEMARYRVFLINLSQKFKFQYIASYDWRHRQRLAHSGSMLFSMVDHDLYVTIFDGGAVRVSNRCAKCTSIDHTTSECPRATSNGRGSSARSRGHNRGRRGGGRQQK